MQKQQSILLELHYLPSVQYFTKFIHFSSVIIEQHEHYTKGSYRNRCHLAAANGPLALSIPLQKGKNQQQAIKSVKISHEENWRNHHWNSIKSAYGNTPYFEYYADGLAAFYQKKYDYLFEFNWTLLEWLLAKLQIETDVQVTNQYNHRLEGEALDIQNGTVDFRNFIQPKRYKQQPDPLFEAAYYAQAFEDRHGFLGNLSILDLLFCAGPQAIFVLENSIPVPHNQ